MNDLKSAPFSGASGSAIAGFQPTGDGRLHIGNLFASALPFAALGDSRPKFALIADAHALSLGRVPEGFAKAKARMARELIAVGVADRAALFEQTAVPEIFALHALLSSFASLGDLRRMTQFEEKSKMADGEPLALLSYPCLMAADMLALGAASALVGEDQRQHMELARTISHRARERAGIALSSPEALATRSLRIRSLSDPLSKMSKSSASLSGTIFLDETPESLRRKISRAVTDSERLPSDPGEFDARERPGAANLISLCALSEGVSERKILSEMAGLGHGALKARTGDALIALLDPIQRRLDSVTDAQARSILSEGAEQARAVASRTYREALRSLGTS